MTVSDRRAVMPRYEQEKMKRQSSLLSRGIKSARTMRVHSVGTKDILTQKEAAFEAADDFGTMNRLILSGQHKPVHSIPPS